MVLYLSTFVPFLIVAGCIIVIVMLINSTYGRAFKAIRDDEVAAEAMGINLAKHKMLSFVTSSFFAGVGGAHVRHVCGTNAQAKVFTATMTYEILLIVVIGGIGSISGSVHRHASCMSACSEWWLRFLDTETYIGTFKVPPAAQRLPHGGVLRRHHGGGAVLPQGHHGRQRSCRR